MTRDLDLCEGKMAKYLPFEAEQVIGFGTVDIPSTATLPKVIVGLARISMLFLWDKHELLLLPLVCVEFYYRDSKGTDRGFESASRGETSI